MNKRKLPIALGQRVLRVGVVQFVENVRQIRMEIEVGRKTLDPEYVQLRIQVTRRNFVLIVVLRLAPEGVDEGQVGNVV